MDIRWTIRGLNLCGVIASAIYLVRMYSTIDAVTLFLSAWILMPYLILVRLNESKKDMYKHPRMFVLLVIMILSLGIYMMLDIVVFTPDPLGGVAMLFWVPLQTLCILAAWGACK